MVCQEGIVCVLVKAIHKSVILDTSLDRQVSLEFVFKSEPTNQWWINLCYNLESLDRTTLWWHNFGHTLLRLCYLRKRWWLNWLTPATTGLSTWRKLSREWSLSMTHVSLINLLTSELLKPRNGWLMLGNQLGLHALWYGIIAWDESWDESWDKGEGWFIEVGSPERIVWGVDNWVVQFQWNFQQLDWQEKLVFQFLTAHKQSHLSPWF